MARNKTGGPRPGEPRADGLERLWAPWRRQYVVGAGPRVKGCIFCFGRLGKAALHRRLVLYSGPHAFVMLNRYPYASGHLMIAPRRHLASPELLDRAERAALGDLIAEAVRCVRAAYQPAGINLGANLGRSAGAGIADHLHWHVVPRWEGDTNFMTVLGGTRVLNEMLEQTFSLLSPLFKPITVPVS